MEFHEASELFPMMGKTEFEELKTDIQMNGLLLPITLADGKILDGRNRFKACSDLGIDPKFERLSDDIDPFCYVWSLNAERRHLPPGQKATIFVYKKEKSEEWQMSQLRKREAANRARSEATKAQPRSEKGLFGSTGPVSRDTTPERSRDEISQEARVSPATVARAQALTSKRPDLAERVRKGEVTLTNALRIAKKEEISEGLQHYRGGRNSTLCQIPEIPQNCSSKTRAISDIQTLIDNGETFGTIYADPPWPYQNQGTRSATSGVYKPGAWQLSLGDLAALPVKDITAEKAHLHLWTTNAFIFDAKDIIEAWGFEYKSCFVWVKPQIGIGNYWRVSHEFLLLGVKGGLTFADRNQKSWLEFKRSRHSVKPEVIATIIEKTSPPPYLELFGRRTRQGWTVLGNQIERTLFNEHAFNRKEN